MRAEVSKYELRSVKNLSEALVLMKESPDEWKAFSGGTDLMVSFEAGKLRPYRFLNLWNLPELRGIEVQNETVILGAATTYSEIRHHETLQREFPLLVQAAKVTGALAIQNRGTLGGNIANGSPAADSPPALLVYEAEVKLQSANRSRWIPYADFHTGYKKSVLLQDELLTSIRLKRETSFTHVQYRKVGTRNAQAISKVCFAGVAVVKGKKVEKIRLALGSVAPIPLRCRKTESHIEGQTMSKQLVKFSGEILKKEIQPIDDIRSTAHYRRTISVNLLTEFLEQLWNG